MKSKIDLFNNGDYKIINELIEKRISILKEDENFNKKYDMLSIKIDEFEIELRGEQKNKFQDIIKLFYEMEEYYFAFAYSLGVKYGKDLKEI